VTEEQAPRIGTSSVVRFVRDGTGELWRVREMPPGSYDRRRQPTLVFDCDAAMRRVRSYPANWHELDDETLIALKEKI
jgi:hypothetical protein